MKSIYPVVDRKTAVVLQKCDDAAAALECAVVRGGNATAIVTPECLDEFSGPQLAKMYSELSGVKIGKFSDRKTGILRTWKFLHPSHHNVPKEVHDMKKKATKKKAATKGAPTAKKSAAATKKKLSKKTTKKSAKKGTPKKGIGALISGLLIKGKGTDEVLSAVLKEFPDASTNASNVSWYRSKLRTEGKLK